MTEPALGKPPRRLLAISVSLRKASTNTAALEALARLALQDVCVVWRPKDSLDALQAALRAG